MEGAEELRADPATPDPAPVAADPDGVSCPPPPRLSCAAAGGEDAAKPPTLETTNGGLPRVTSQPPVTPDVVVTAAAPAPAPAQRMPPPAV